MLYKRSVLKNFSKFTDKHKKQSSRGVLSKEKKMFLKILQNTQTAIFVAVSFLTKLQAGSLKLSETATGDVLWNKVFLKNFANFTEKNLCWSLFLIKLQFWGPATLLKKTLTQVLCYETCKLFKNNYFEEHVWTSTSKPYLRRDSNIGVFQ